VVVCGVNGNGKTTSVGKLAKKLTSSGKKVLVVGCDTFRAAALEQLEIWSERAGAVFIKSEEKSDPASVAYKAVQHAIEKHYDVVLIDTAGRLHNNTNLMDELAKIERSLNKVLPGAPHDNILVLDATTGQNALLQVESFGKAVKVSGLIINKLDGSAKAGVLLAIADKFKTPIHYIGIGEGIDDLIAFEAEGFAKALLGIQ
jgi:fused signal recognition particle receptor